jgi:adenine-specific DNA-methyltransferase
MNEEGAERPVRGVVAELYAPQNDDKIELGERVFYTQRNAQFIDTARRVIDDAPEGLRAHLVAPLLYVASVHANTSGVFKGFYKNSETGIGQFGGNGKDALTRICKPFEIPYPIYSEHECSFAVHLGDSNLLAKTLPHVDVAYLDPPYNQHPYGSNYFMLNLIAKNRRPTEISDVSGIPIDWNRSAYNKRPQARSALFELAKNLDANFLLISFNSEGFISRNEMVEMLKEIGKTDVLEIAYNTFRGSRNLGDRDIHVTEYLYLVEKG